MQFKTFNLFFFFLLSTIRWTDFYLDSSCAKKKNKLRFVFSGDWYCVNDEWVKQRAYPLFTTVLTYDDGQGEDEEGSLPHLGGYGSKLPPGILPHGLPQVKEVQPAITAVEQEQKREETKEGIYYLFLNKVQFLLFPL